MWSRLDTRTQNAFQFELVDGFVVLESCGADVGVQEATAAATSGPVSASIAPTVHGASPDAGGGGSSKGRGGAGKAGRRQWRGGSYEFEDYGSGGSYAAAGLSEDGSLTAASYLVAEYVDGSSARCRLAREHSPLRRGKGRPLKHRPFYNDLPIAKASKKRTREEEMRTKEEEMGKKKNVGRREQRARVLARNLVLKTRVLPADGVMSGLYTIAERRVKIQRYLAEEARAL